MLFSWLQSWTEWNPQLWREVKGRLTQRNVLFAAVLSLLSQVGILMTAWREFQLKIHLMLMRGESGETLAVGWQIMWFNVFKTLTWLALLLLLMLGSYLLVRDLVREEQQRTLTFLRLSPESGHSILLGKVLGVPVLLYVAIALILPLHWWAAIQANLSTLFVFSIDLFIVISCAFFYSFSLLYALSWRAKAQAWYVALSALIVNLTLFLITKPLLSLSYHKTTASTDSSNTTVVSTLFFNVILLIMLGIITSQLWQMAIRLFRHPPLQP